MMMRRERHVSRGGCVLPVLHSYTINTLHHDDDDDDDDDDDHDDYDEALRMTLKEEIHKILHSHYSAS